MKINISLSEQGEQGKEILDDDPAELNEEFILPEFLPSELE